MTKLYELAQAIQEVEARLEHEEAGPDVDAVALLLAALDSLQGDTAEKLETCAKVIANLEADAEKCRDEEKRIASRRHGVESRVEGIREYMRACIESLGVDEKGKHRVFKTALFTISVAKGKRSIDESKLDLACVPTEYVEYVAKVKKGELLQWIEKTGEIPAGCEQAIREPELSLRIR